MYMLEGECTPFPNPHCCAGSDALHGISTTAELGFGFAAPLMSVLLVATARHRPVAKFLIALGVPMPPPPTTLHSRLSEVGTALRSNGPRE